MMKRRLSVIFGTRPEAIKLCPLVACFATDHDLAVHVCVTGQHRHMLDQVLRVFDVVPDADLNLMQSSQTLAQFTSRAIAAIDVYLSEAKPAMVIVQGDTTTVLSAALCAFYHRIPVAHVEAGLRTYDKFSPYPEEINRVSVTRLADLHFAPTESAKNNLLREGIPAHHIHVTGNTVIDALFRAMEEIHRNPPSIPELPAMIQPGTAGSRVVLITGHRRENFGRGFQSICQAIGNLARRFGDVHFVYPVHLNPNVSEPVHRLLSGLPNIHLIAPLPYLPFVAMMERATFILTDSGGVQEEAPSLGKPVLVMRDTTERPEALQAGAVCLVGTCTEEIEASAAMLLTDTAAYAKMANTSNPYGDGRASPRIVAAIRSFLGLP